MGLQDGCQWDHRTFIGTFGFWGNEQVNGVDYGLTFSPVMELSTVKVILVHALRCGVASRHGDIPNAYLKADKEKHLEIFLAIS